VIISLNTVAEICESELADDLAQKWALVLEM